MKKKVLFVCTSNMTRSPTCEDIFKDSPLYETKSAGTAPYAVVRVTQEMINWADIVIVMCERTDKHSTFLKDHFNVEAKVIYDLDLEDFIYIQRGQSELVQVLKEKLKKYLTLP